MADSYTWILKQWLPFWSKLTAEQREFISSSILYKVYQKGTIIYHGEYDCAGLFLVAEGRLRVFITSDKGKEITLYRLLEGDVCLFSASCIFNNINFDISIETEKDSKVIAIPAAVYDSLNKTSLPIAEYTNHLLASRMSEVMWVLEKVLFGSISQRLAEFILYECDLEMKDVLYITHDEVARHLGTAREVVTRMLQYFQSEGALTLMRGSIQVIDRKKLQHLAD